MRYDSNVLERRATELIGAGRAQDAIKIYLFMADGDPSTDAGYLGKRLGELVNVQRPEWKNVRGTLGQEAMPREERR